MMHTLTKWSLIAGVLLGLTATPVTAEDPLLVSAGSATELTAVAYFHPTVTGLEVMAGYLPSREVRRWAAFEDEFGIREPETSRIKGTLQVAKYNLDQTVFELDNFVNYLESALEFEYRPGGAGNRSPRMARTYFSPLHDIWENARFKSEVDLELSGRAFVGITFQFPFGN